MKYDALKIFSVFKLKPFDKENLKNDALLETAGKDTMSGQCSSACSGTCDCACNCSSNAENNDRLVDTVFGDCSNCTCDCACDCGGYSHGDDRLADSVTDRDHVNMLIGVISKLVQGNREDLLQFLASNQNNGSVLNSIGAALINHGLYDEALSVYKKLSELQPNDRNTLYVIGDLLNRMGSHEEAVKMFSTILQKYPDETWALVSRGSGLLKLGKNEEAQKDYRRVLEIDPENKFAKEAQSYFDSIRSSAPCCQI